MDKSKMCTVKNVPLTQSLFLEHQWDKEKAIFTLRDYDVEHDGKTYVSLKRLYLEAEDPVEYFFATEYLLGWNHWKKMEKNKWLSKHIEEWRAELSLKIRSEAIRSIQDKAAEPNGYQAAKFLAERGWDRGSVGRPKKDMTDAQKAEDDALMEEFNADIKQISDYRK